MSTRVFKYGAHAPTENVAQIEDQLRRAHQYRNHLIQVTVESRAEYDAIMRQHPPVAAAEAELASYPEKGLTDEQKEGRKAAREARRVARAEAKVLFASQIVELGEMSKDLDKAGRATNGLYWGTGGLVDRSMEQSREDPAPPRFLAYQGRGRLGVQLQGTADPVSPEEKKRLAALPRAERLAALEKIPRGLSVSALLGGQDTRLRLTPLPESAKKKPDGHRSGRNFTLRMRIGSEGQTPIWGTWEVIIHRALPVGGIVTMAWMQRERVGPDFRWSLCVTVRGGVLRNNDADPARKGSLAIDLGWRMKDLGCRVGYWVDDEGDHGEILVPQEILNDLEFVRSLQGIREKNHTAFKQRFVAWLASGVTIPTWLAEATKTVGLWKSPNRLARLGRRWERNRFAGDEALFDTRYASPSPVTDPARRVDGRDDTRGTCPRDKNGILHCTDHFACWLHRDLHLHRWESHASDNIRARRNNQYRVLAAKLARRYARIVIEDFALPQVAGRQGLDEDATDAEKVMADRASSRRHSVAPGIFREAVINACSSRETEIVKVKAAYTTQECFSCRVIAPFDAAAAIEHCCTTCGAVWDQDRNAAQNILRAGSVVKGSAGPLAGVKSARQQRFSRRRDRQPRVKPPPEGDCSKPVE